MIKRALRRSLTYLLDPLIQRLGYEKPHHATVTEASKNSLLRTFFTNLQSLGLSPQHIIDVGANHGTWTRQALRYFPEAYYTLLEPQERLRASIQDLMSTNPRISFHAVGAGSSAGIFQFTIVDRDDSCTFRFSEAEAAQGGFTQQAIPIVTLNELVRERGLPVPEIVKIDAEGFDIEVLRGASDLFGRTEVFLVEAGIVNKDLANSYLAVTQFMDANGYRLFEITDLNRPFVPNVLWLVELAFVRKGGLLDSATIV